MLAFGPFIGLNLTLFERVKEFFKGNNQSFGFVKGFFSALVTGIASKSNLKKGTIAALATNPFEVPKVRMQVQRAEKTSGSIKDVKQGHFGYRNVFHGIYLIMQKEGFFSLWKGLVKIE